MLKLTFSKVLIATLLGAAVAIFFFWETRFSFPVLYWHYKFERDLNEKGSVKLADLVSFKFEKVYLLHPYDGNWEAEKDLFSAWSWIDPFWWDQMRHYWTIAYKRSGRPPFLIKMKTYEWELRNYVRSNTDNSDATLRIVQPNTIEATYCARSYARCIALDDAKSRVYDAERGVFTEPHK